MPMVSWSRWRGPQQPGGFAALAMPTTAAIMATRASTVFMVECLPNEHQDRCQGVSYLSQPAAHGNTSTAGPAQHSSQPEQCTTYHGKGMRCGSAVQSVFPCGVPCLQNLATTCGMGDDRMTKSGKSCQAACPTAYMSRSKIRVESAARSSYSSNGLSSVAHNLQGREHKTPAMSAKPGPPLPPASRLQGTYKRQTLGRTGGTPLKTSASRLWTVSCDDVALSQTWGSARILSSAHKPALTPSTPTPRKIAVSSPPAPASFRLDCAPQHRRVSAEHAAPPPRSRSG